MAKSSLKKFKATLRPDGTAMNWTVVTVPRSVSAALTDGGRQPKVKGEINGFAFRTSLFATKSGDHILLVNKSMQKAAGVARGSVAEFLLELDKEERSVAMPAELKQAMTGAAALRKYYDKLTYSVRKYVCDLVAKPKSAEARTRQAERMAELLFSMMEGEREPPPVLQAAFARNALAAQGWKLLTANQRRGHLWGIFYYASPESRQKRAKKAVEDAVKAAQKVTATKLGDETI